MKKMNSLGLTLVGALKELGEEFSKESVETL